MQLPDFVGGSYPSQSRNANNQRTINWIPTLAGTPGAQGKTPLILVNAPGLEFWHTIGDLPIRGTHEHNSVLYAVTGPYVYKILNNKITTLIGTLETTSGKVWIEHNANNQIGFVDGKNFYLYNTSTALFSKTAQQPIAAPTSLMFIDQYFVVSLANSQFFQLSGINDGTLWSALDIAAAEANPDNLLAVWNLHRQIYLLGAQTTEIWFNAGTSPFPFQPTSGVIDWGIYVADTAAQVADRLTWLGLHKDGGISVVSTSGLQAEAISTPGLEAHWRQYPSIADAYAFSYRIDGNDCYVITFPSGEETFVFDFTTGLWHERRSYNVGSWIANHGVRLSTKQLVGDRRNGNLYVMSPDTYDENSQPIVRERYSAHLWDDLKTLIVHALQVDFETGVSAPDQTPTVRLRWSKDGGHIWSNWVSVSLGPIGDYKRRAIWRRLGAARDFMFHIQTSDATKSVVLGASLEASQGIS